MKHFLCLKLHWIINDIQRVRCHVRLLMVSWSSGHFMKKLVNISKLQFHIYIYIYIDRVLNFSLLHMLTTYAFQLKLNLNSFYYLLLIIVMHKVSRSRHLFVLKNMNLRKGVSVVFDVLCICILIWKENCYMFIIVIAMNYPNFSAWNMWSNQHLQIQALCNTPSVCWQALTCLFPVLTIMK